MVAPNHTPPGGPPIFNLGLGLQAAVRMARIAFALTLIQIVLNLAAVAAFVPQAVSQVFSFAAAACGSSAWYIARQSPSSHEIDAAAARANGKDSPP